MYIGSNLLFADKIELKAFTGGVVGEIVDAGEKNRLGEGYPFYMFLSCGSDTTATGEPTIKVFLESADDKAFSENKIRFQMFPDMKKADMRAGESLKSNPCPHNMRRYNRLYIETNIELACAGFSSGLVMDVQTNFGQV